MEQKLSKGIKTQLFVSDLAKKLGEALGMDVSTSMIQRGGDKKDLWWLLPEAKVDDKCRWVGTSDLYGEEIVLISFEMEDGPVGALFLKETGWQVYPGKAQSCGLQGLSDQDALTAIIAEFIPNVCCETHWREYVNRSRQEVAAQRMIEGPAGGQDD